MNRGAVGTGGRARDRWLRGVGRIRRTADRIGRMTSDPWEIGRARRLLPAILDAVPGRAGWERWSVRRAIRTAGGLVVLLVGPGGAPPVAAVKLGTAAPARAAIRRQLAIRRHLDIAAGPALAELPAPAILAAGMIAGRPFIVEEALPGRRASLLPPAAQLALEPIAAERIARLHEATARQLVIGPPELDRWVVRRLHRIADLPGGERGAHRRAALTRLQDELCGALAGRSVRAGWIHGDYWTGNVLVDDELRIRGVIDWDSAASCELPLHDRLHLATHMRHLLERRAVGEVVAARLGGTAGERTRDTSGDPVALGGEVSERQALLLYWARFVAVNLARRNPLVRTTRWLAANVDSVVSRL